MKQINVTLEIGCEKEFCGKCKYNGITRYGQPGAMWQDPVPYHGLDYCQVFKKDLKYTEDCKNAYRCKECLNSEI